MSSRMGAMALQGPHHSAQKSSRTGVSDLRTSVSNVASVVWTILPLTRAFLLVSSCSVTGECPMRHNIQRVWEQYVRGTAPLGPFCNVSEAFFQVMTPKVVIR